METIYLYYESASTCTYQNYCATIRGGELVTLGRFQRTIHLNYYSGVQSYTTYHQKKSGTLTKSFNVKVVSTSE